MKKVILLALCCLAYISVQAQSVTTAEQIKKLVDQKVQTITSKVPFSEPQKAFLIEYLTFSAKEKAGNFAEDLKANPIRDVNMDTFYTEAQRKVIQDVKSQDLKNNLLPTDSTTKF
ncbi:hypothetical protein [uncultured Dokdonia sp.]|uniref:hypothetical protein n=1 Tax=uncultured Dokdonia sp. TaxID=575653 RepID=UPI00261EA2C9|nr:hypothetical protein [uncultured Dokdonia sp.]